MMNSLDWLTSQLERVVDQGNVLLRMIGFDKNLEIYGLVNADEHDPNTKYRLEAVDRILYGLYEAQDTLSFLRARESRKVHTMTYLPSVDRYGFYDGNGRFVEFHCGHGLEVLLKDDEGKQHWIPTSIEYSQGRYYLVEHRDVPLDGLLIRDGS